MGNLVCLLEFRAVGTQLVSLGCITGEGESWGGGVELK